ncbi:thermonuclease family protein, partial [Candidatus Bipolaricaulota bacterium]|nr:thermonuclease family protein [Candidatus Bipolaricaulota bacterium]
MRHSLPLTILGLLILTAFAASSQTPDVAFATRDGHVLRIVDGDTIELYDGETVRLLGIDTPEMGFPFSMEAKLFTMELLSRQDVRLELDVQERDVYGRLLAHVYVETEEDGWVLVNAELVRAGLAELLSYHRMRATTAISRTCSMRHSSIAVACSRRLLAKVHCLLRNSRATWSSASL